MIKIVCSSCQKPLSLDETKLPMKEVAFPCPVCKTRLTVDRRTLGTDAAAVQSGAVAAPPADAIDTSDDDSFGAKAILVGADPPSLRQGVKLMGLMPFPLPTPEQAREFYMQEFPQVVILNPPQLTPPPLDAFQPII